MFTVKKGQLYRFRLVGAQGTVAYKFSIDDHKLIVVGTDGYWLEPIKEVDYIIIHSGEHLHAPSMDPARAPSHAPCMRTRK